MNEKELNALEVVQKWFADNWWTVALVVIGAYLTRRFGALIIEKLIRRTVHRREHGDISQEDIKKRQDTLIVLFSALLRVFVWSVAGFTILRMLFPTLDLTPILAGASVMGVALGFGAQTLIRDFLSGLFIILENQYRVGDVVQIGEANGTVEHISLHSTIVRDNDGSVHYIPNGSITHAINKTMGFAKINLTIQVASTTDIDKLAEDINKLGEKMAGEEKWKKRIIDPPHFLGIDSFTTNDIEVK